MDANGQRFWLAQGGTPWKPDVPGTLELLPGHLRLGSQTIAQTYPEDAALAETRLGRAPMTRDRFGSRAFVDNDGVTVRSTGAFPDPEKPEDSPVLFVAPAPITDLALGADGFLYLLFDGKIRIHPLLDRYSATTLDVTGFAAWRFAAAPDGGGWALDRTGKKLARLSGKLWLDPLSYSEPPPDAFTPVQDNPTPPVLTVIPEGWCDSTEDPVAVACSSEGRLAVLLWSASGPLLRLVDELGRRGPTSTLKQLQKPFSLAWLTPERFVVMAAAVPEAIAYSWREGELYPSGEIYPLRDHTGGPFVHSPSPILEYPSKQPTPELPDNVGLRPLVALSLPALARSAKGALASPFDSGAADTAWHRLYVDAFLPPGTGFTIYAAAAESDAAVPSAGAWHAHHFGAAQPAHRQEPRASWVPEASEIPGHAGFTGEAPVKDQSGLFTVLLQRSNFPVRTFRGRFLFLRIELRGNLRQTPCVHALRAYGPRFSYQDKYLPALYREGLFGPEAEVNAPGQASTRADFLGRFLANFEGILTPIEDRVAESWLVTDPQHTPDEALDWLGSWIGVAFEPWYPAAQRRLLLRTAPELFRRRGTLRGLRLALDVATAGGIGAGRIVVVEDFWFRRTLQTVLGVKLDQDYDPLLGEGYISGNSKVGDTLFLSEEGMEKKFLALFDASIQLKGADKKVVEEFFASLAFRVTVIVHETVQPEELKLIERVCGLEAPAHLIVRVRRASGDFMVGLTALLSVDTYLRPAPLPESVTLDTSELGGGDLLLRPYSLDPRLEGISS
jgi:phage tail-like protein